LRRLAVAVGGHALAQAGAVRGQVQDVGVAAFGRHRVGLGQRGRRRGTGHRGGKGVADEVAPAGLGLAMHGADVVAV
jgi:hypothetical protein